MYLNSFADGLVAIGDFLAKIVDIVASVGKKVLGAIEDAYNEVKDIVETLADVMKKVVEFVQSVFVATMRTAVNPVFEVLDNWINLFLSGTSEFIEFGNNIGNSANTLAVDQSPVQILNALIDFIFFVTFGTILIFIAAAVATAIALADAITVTQTSGLASLIKFISNVPIKSIMIAIITELIILTVLDFFVPDDPDNIEGSIIEQLANQIENFVSYSIGFGVTIIDILITGSAIIAIKTRQVKSIPLRGAINIYSFLGHCWIGQ